MKGEHQSRSDLKNVREEKQKDEQALKMIRNICTAVIVMCVLTLLMFCMSGCTTTKYVEVEKVRTDTVYKSKIERDSIWLHDSIEVKVKGDSVLIEKWHTKYKETFIHDTLYHAKVDSIPVPYPVTEYIEKKLSWLQKTLIGAGWILILIVVGGIGWIIVKKKLYKLIM